jgi:drug/metabolite transporter (DMT)-like permease
MSAPAQFATVAYSLAAVLAWGASDFLGGYCTRRANAFLFATVVNAGGLALMLALVSASHATIPSAHQIRWALAAGVSGGASLAIFYRALSAGRMGLTAPVAAVLSAAIPALFVIATQGLPGKTALFGFTFAAAGLWLITRTEDGATEDHKNNKNEDGGRPKGIGMAIFAGIGFAGFYLCVRQAGDGSPFWIASLTRAGGLVITALVVIALRTFRDITAAGMLWAVLTGCIDSAGTVFFVRASQTGRLDEAVVLSSLYPAITVLLARAVLKEHFTRWRFVGLLAALAAVPMIATG